MLNILRTASSHRPSASLVVAIIALIVSLAGTSYAAGVLPRNSVGTKQLKNQSVTGAKVKSNAINSAKVVNRSLLAVDFKKGQLPAGAKGDTGATGAAGSAVAYAQVNGGVTPSLVSGTTKNFTAVTHVGLGNYCLTPAAGISPAAHPAVVSVQSASDDPLTPVGQHALWQANGVGCAAGDYKVRTYRAFSEAMGADALADDVSFVIIVA